MKLILSRFLFTVVVLVASVLVSSEPSKAVTYSYSSQLTNLSVSCTSQPCGGYGSSLTILIEDDLPLGASGVFTVTALMSTDVSGFADGMYLGDLCCGPTGGTVTLSFGSITDWSFVGVVGYPSFLWSASSTPSGDSASAGWDFVDYDKGALFSGYVTASGGPGIWTPNFTPLPASLPLFATGLGALGLLGWRRKRKASVANSAV